MNLFDEIQSDKKFFELNPVGFLETQLYFNCRYIEGRGWCGIHFYIYTVGLVYGLDWSTLEGRYCYPNRLEAVTALAAWDGKGDPPGPWIKHKGKGGEWSNPNKEND